MEIEIILAIAIGVHSIVLAVAMFFAVRTYRKASRQIAAAREKIDVTVVDNKRYREMSFPENRPYVV